MGNQHWAKNVGTKCSGATQGYSISAKQSKFLHNISTLQRRKSECEENLDRLIRDRCFFFSLTYAYFVLVLSVCNTEIKGIKISRCGTKGHKKADSCKQCLEARLGSLHGIYNLKYVSLYLSTSPSR